MVNINAFFLRLFDYDFRGFFDNTSCPSFMRIYVFSVFCCH